MRIPSATLEGIEPWHWSAAAIAVVIGLVLAHKINAMREQKLDWYALRDQQGHLWSYPNGNPVIYQKEMDAELNRQRLREENAPNWQVVRVTVTVSP
jgi:hypothetical protein